MTPFKLNTGDTLQNIKYYMFMTNEYGKPTEGTLDMFLLNFGEIILNGNFSRYITEIIEVQLNHWWSEITLDLEERELKSLAKYTGGFDWFKHIAREGKHFNSLVELKTFILDNEFNVILDVKIKDSIKMLFKSLDICVNNTDAILYTDDCSIEYKDKFYKSLQEFLNTEFNRNINNVQDLSDIVVDKLGLNWGLLKILE